jgi:hypothetical protein
LYCDECWKNIKILPSSGANEKTFKEGDKKTKKMKKWFMLQMWRLQQVATMLTLGMLAINLALQMYTYVGWREGIFETPYYGVPIFLVIIIFIVWGISVFWDLRMKMWRDQMAVTVERNPYAKEKMVAKEVVQFMLLWVPLLDEIGERNEKKKHLKEILRGWVKKAMEDDPSLRAELKELLEYIGRFPELEFIFETIEDDVK